MRRTIEFILLFSLSVTSCSGQPSAPNTEQLTDTTTLRVERLYKPGQKIKLKDAFFKSIDYNPINIITDINGFEYVDTFHLGKYKYFKNDLGTESFKAYYFESSADNDVDQYDFLIIGKDTLYPMTGGSIYSPFDAGSESVEFIHNGKTFLCITGTHPGAMGSSINDNHLLLCEISPQGNITKTQMYKSINGHISQFGDFNNDGNLDFMEISKERNFINIHLINIVKKGKEIHIQLKEIDDYSLIINKISIN